ncbi:MAG: HAMP domain-containing sensor histidine kinase [Candidatus Marinimicrobia bacterium]|jgi:signal transduction histidine kinase|nr:HAMP domain-containing sensor histidine kinase [Candidatus Neomarinimicrobiota bacterium]MDP6592598.1 HAMP domain-containing sensor histidine kinase [Candidatus Neomarinimicrobiota bacterium]MDP6836671.1 HAMP domain-containing sensor histidine kinase [Candidatus Neomarinimicrobiota bacterium]MDP6965922.1 HAMP domain-containing sensor histidine kinase [Candidatus Neomarinimicrobiota bacterium]|tara:strand:- start:18332 stop:19531 length:1200 start_codon:yes stop_codon:yes gene_type:complete
MKIYRQAGNIKAALFVGAIALMSGLFFYTQSIISDLRTESRDTVTLYARLIAKGVTEASDSELEFVFTEIIQKVTFPIIHTDSVGNPIIWRNLEGSEELNIEAVLGFMRDMDSQNTPIPLMVSIQSEDYPGVNEVNLGYLHYGDSVLIRRLRIMPFIEIGAVAFFIFLGFSGFQVIRNTEKQHIWFGMARETAHQLGTPVSSLMGWLERLQEKPEAAAEVSDQMADDVDRLKKISDRFARMGSVPRVEEIDLRALIQSTATYFQSRLPQSASDVALSVVDGDPVTVTATPTLLSWALENLVKNAIDSVDKTGGKVTISAEAAANEAIISVTDTGRGIPRRDRKNVFRPGYTTKERGWGVGLSMTKRIIEDFQDGKVRIVKTDVGTGTTFEIRLPLLRSR